MMKIIYTFISLLIPLVFFGQTTTWNGSVDNDWQTAGNWSDGIPAGTDNVTIPNSLANYPIIDDGATVALTNNLTIESGASLTIAPNGRLTVAGTLTNNAGTTGLVIQSDDTGTGSLIHSTASVDGTVNMFLEGTQWHYISSPVNGINYSEFNTVDFRDWNSSIEWDGSSYDPWVDYTGTLVNAKGYANYETENTTTLYGTLNQGSIGISVLTYDGGNSQFQGWNLVGNPYTSAIDWTEVNYLPADIAGAIYFWTGTTYASWVAPNSSTNGGTQYIPQGQGFFVKCLNTAGATLTFNNDDRVHDSQSYWKSNKQTSGSIKLIAQGNGLYHETLVRFLDGATDEFDGIYDAYHLPSSNPDVPQVYSLNSSKTTTFSINCLPEITNEIIIPLGFLVTTQGSYSISPSEMNINAQNIYLQDAETASLIDLVKNPTYIFEFNDGVANNDRFLLRIIPNTTNVVYTADNKVKMYPNPSRGIVNIITDINSNESGSFEIYNLNGQKIISEQLNSGTTKRIIDMSSCSNGVYNVKVNVEGKTHFKKLILMK